VIADNRIKIRSRMNYSEESESLESQTIQLNKGLNIIDLPVFNKQKSEVLVVSLFINNQLTFTQKALF